MGQQARLLQRNSAMNMMKGEIVMPMRSNNIVRWGKSQQKSKSRRTFPPTSSPSFATAGEQHFYEGYDWCLNVFPTIGEACDFLQLEKSRFAQTKEDWQRRERVLNIYFLACGILNCVDELLRGPTLKLPTTMTSLPGVKFATRNINFVAQVKSKFGLIGIRKWRNQWLEAIDNFATLLIGGLNPNNAAFAEKVASLASLANSLRQKSLCQQRLGIPSPFTRLDLTPEDVIALGELVALRCPDQSQPIVLVGLRTSGSYFCPLIRAVLLAKGYQSVSTATLEPSKGLDRVERRTLTRCAVNRCLAIVVDDPPHSGSAIISAFDVLQKEGFALSNIKAAVPIHPAKRNWYAPLPSDYFICLPPESWHKQILIRSGVIETRIREYYRGQGFSEANPVKSRKADQINSRFPVNSADGRSDKLKRVFEIDLKTSSGKAERRFVLVKSVGSGWLGYGAFLSGQRLAGFVPTLLGLRDGLLYMEWVTHQSPSRSKHGNRTTIIATIAAYCAARQKTLRLNPATTQSMDLKRQNNGVRLLEKALSRVYGAPFASTFIRTAIGKRLRALPNDVPVLIDGNMVPSEWITSGPKFLKTDYEHHGLGKAAANVTDVAFDLASAILNFSLTKQEERTLLERYIELTQDHGIGERLFLHKLMAGLWSMNQAQEQIHGHANGSSRQQENHGRFLAAWHFLTIECARHIGLPARQAAVRRWQGPLVFLDVDGVIDRRILGFPTTSAAGVAALLHLNRNGFSVALNTARSVSEVKEYCDAYGLVGGSAEYGSYIWDAVNGNGRVAIDAATAKQLEKLRLRLRAEPGIFLDERHEYSIRAFSYKKKSGGLFENLSKRSEVGDGAVAPISSFVIDGIINELGLDLISFHHTGIDTTVIAKSVNKGTGLITLRDWVLGADVKTIAVGDQRPDLHMFRAASYSYAPANIDCRKHARILGCKIAKQANQNGLLEIAQDINARFDGQRKRGLTSAPPEAHPPDQGIFFHLLEIADNRPLTNFLRTLFDLSAFKVFFR